MCVKVRTVLLEYWRVAKMQNAPPRQGGVTWPVTLLVQIQPLQPMFRWFSGITLLSYRRNSRSIRLRNSNRSHNSVRHGACSKTYAQSMGDAKLWVVLDFGSIAVPEKRDTFPGTLLYQVNLGVLYADVVQVAELPARGWR